jgi:Tol biopolymer transport system component
VRPIANGLFYPLGRISPDGHRYATSIIDAKQGTNDIWIFDLDRDSSERLTFKSEDEIAPVWTPNGRSIYYRSDGYGGPPDIFRLNLGEDRGTVTYSGPGVEEPHDVSRDGKWMLFVDHRQAGAADIYALPLDPVGKPRPFAVTPFNEQSPRFSPDGRWVAYESNASGRPEIYVRAFEGSELAARISKDGGTRPRWRDDGNELYFIGPAGRLTTASMNGGVSTGPPRVLFQSADMIEFEPAPDGSRFLVQTEERKSDPPVHVLVNWPARLAGRQ